MKFLKVGRLYPGDDGLVHIIRDGYGELGTMTIEDVEEILSGEAAQPIIPDGLSYRYLIKDKS